MELKTGTTYIINKSYKFFRNKYAKVFLDLYGENYVISLEATKTTLIKIGKI